jgi:hypothetical protein
LKYQKFIKKLVGQVVWGVHIGSYKHETEKELELINEKQKKFVYELFKESYEVLGIGGVLSERR